MSELRVQPRFGPEESAVIQLVDQELELEQRPITGSSQLSFDVEAGSYLLRALWSDGRKTQQIVDVPAVGTSLDLESPGVEAPPDVGWMDSFAPEQTVKTATRNSNLSEETAWRLPTTPDIGSTPSPLSTLRGRIQRNFEETGFVLRGPSPPVPRLWQRSAAGSWAETPLGANPEAVLGGAELHLDVGEGLHLVEMRSGSAAQFVSLPSERSIVVMRWFNSESYVYSSAEVRTADDDVETLRGFIQNGELAVAKTAAPEVMAERYLRSKVSAPRIAALGAYFLLRVGDLERLHDWPDNLTNWKDWLPDGPVIAAWQRLRSEAPDYSEAYDLLIEAMRRGLPVYTEGVRLLKDGLELFANDDERDWDVADQLAELDRYGKAMTWSKSETTYFGHAPDEPTAAARLATR